MGNIGNSKDSSSKDDVTNDQDEEEYVETCCDKLYGYSLMMWDGLGFFGFATSKLNRLRGVKVTFMTPCTNCQFILTTLIGLAVTIAILAT